jgi:hypothetical protein
MKSGLSFFIAARRCEISDLEQLARTSALVNVVGGVVHGLQRERGISNVFLGSRGKRFAARLDEQVKACSQLEMAMRASFDALDTEAGHLGNGPACAGAWLPLSCRRPWRQLPMSSSSRAC